MLFVWGDLWAVYERGRVWCYIVRETCEYHSIEGSVILERPVGTTADYRDILFVSGRPACVNC